MECKRECKVNVSKRGPDRREKEEREDGENRRRAKAMFAG